MMRAFLMSLDILHSLNIFKDNITLLTFQIYIFLNSVECLWRLLFLQPNLKEENLSFWDFSQLWNSFSSPLLPEQGSMLSVISFIAGGHAPTPLEGCVAAYTGFGYFRNPKGSCCIHRGAEDTIKGNFGLKRCLVTRYYCFLRVPSASLCANTSDPKQMALAVHGCPVLLPYMLNMLFCNDLLNS